MKTIKILYLAFVLISVISCDKDSVGDIPNEPKEVESIPKDGELPAESLSLAFTVQTQQDQMGDFADNAMVLFNGKVWSVGGINAYSTPNLSSDVWSSENGKNWVSVTNDKFSERKGHTLTVYDDKMWLIGGVDDLGTFLGEIYFSTDGVNWTMVTALSPTLLTPAYHSTVVFNNKLYVIMDGLDDHVTVLSSSDGIDWNIETDNAFSNREDFEAVVFENAIYVIGGKHLDSSFNEIWKSTDGIEWNLVTPSTDIFSPRYSHTATVHNNKVWIVGGVTGPLDETHIDFWYSENMEDWTEYDGPLPATEGLIQHAALSSNEELRLFGGLQPNASGSAFITGEIRSIKEEE
jgi:hypothetical protein